ncbi:Peptidyl-prolyl cis-trans isomerase FKBP53 [Bienertia sinuspersici]
MAFWGVEIKSGKPFTLSPDKSCGRLRISQATLGVGSSNNKCLVQCNVGKKTPVMLCCLLPDKTESCPLELEFEEAEEVTFSVVGPRTVYLTGYFLGNSRRLLGGDDESESYGEDVGVTDSEDFSNDGDYEQDSFIDDNDPEEFSPSPSSSFETNKTKAGTKKNSRKRLKKKYELSESEDDGAISSKKTKDVPVVEIDEENQLPISFLSGIAKPDDKDSKRKRHALSGNTSDDHQSEDQKVKKKKKRKNNKENEASDETANPVSVAKNETKSAVDTVEGKKDRARTLSSGLIVEELKAGEKDGEVTVHYTGTLKENGQVFDSTTGKDPLKFRLGKGRVMDGLDQGIEGMRVGGKRRLQIPPALGYGSEGSSRVPPNSWLIMDVELLRVR